MKIPVDLSDNTVPQDGWFVMENHVKMDDLGVPLFEKNSENLQIRGLSCSSVKLHTPRFTSAHCVTVGSRASVRPKSTLFKAGTIAWLLSVNGSHLWDDSPYMCYSNHDSRVRSRCQSLHFTHVYGSLCRFYKWKRMDPDLGSAERVRIRLLCQIFIVASCLITFTL